MHVPHRFSGIGAPPPRLSHPWSPRCTAPGVIDHRRDRGRRCREHAHEVDVDVTAPAPLALLDEFRGAHAARVVHEDGQPAEMLTRAIDRGTDLVRVHHVGGQREALATEFLDRLHRALGAFGDDVEHADIRTELGEPERDPHADPTAATGDERDLVLQPDIRRVEARVERILRQLDGFFARELQGYAPMP